MATKSTLDRLTSLGEEVIGKASQNPNLARVVGAATQLKDRVDDLQKRVRGLEAMEKRIAELEQRLKKLENAQKRAVTAAKKPPDSPKP
jgi:predicted  nucleic acid-binding Zn-ribbon protein